MAITYINGRLVRSEDGDKAIAAAKIKKQLQEENAARLKGLEKQQKSYVAPVVKNPAGAGTPPAAGPAAGGAGMAGKANMTPERSYVEQQLTILGMKDTPANRAKLRNEYRTDQAKVEAETSQAAAQTAGDQSAFEAILNAATGYESTAKTASEKALDALRELYAPQETALGTQRQAQIDLLKRVLGQSAADIDTGEQNFISGIRPTTAYTDLPLTALPQQQNALIAALQSQGAGTGEVQAQQASDAALNDFTRQLLQRSAAQYGDVQQNYLNSLINAGRGASQAGRDYLSLEKPRLESGIQSRYDELLAGLAGERASAESDVQTRLQDALNKAAEVRVGATEKYPTAVTPVVPEAPTTPPNAAGGVPTFADNPGQARIQAEREAAAAEEERKRMALIMAARRAGFNA
jgi:hypothetical protein